MEGTPDLVYSTIMSRKTPVFSLLHKKALIEKRITVSLFHKVRQRLWHFLKKFDASYGVKRDRNDRFIDNSSIKDEVTLEVPGLYGWTDIEYDKDAGECRQNGLATFEFVEEAVGVEGTVFNLGHDLSFSLTFRFKITVSL